MEHRSIDKDVGSTRRRIRGRACAAEWIKFMSVFFNEEEKANLYFAREKAAFEATAASTASLSTALYADPANRKTCAGAEIRLGLARRVPRLRTPCTSRSCASARA